MTTTRCPLNLAACHITDSAAFLFGLLEIHDDSTDELLEDMPPPLWMCVILEIL